MDLIANAYISFVNLDHRTDRLAHMEDQLSKVGIEAVRTRGLFPKECTNHRVEKMQNRTPGAIGCHFSQVSIMQSALTLEKHAWVMEDDIIFCSDFMDRLEHMEKFISENPWDVFWLGAAFHVKAWWHPIGRSGMQPDCSAQLGKDAEATHDSRIVRTYGAYNTFAYIVNKDSIQKILDLFDKHLHESIGIDWLFIKLQPQLNCFSFVPGAVYQRDDYSDIGVSRNGERAFTQWSGALNNGPHVWQNKIEDFDPTYYKWY